MSGVESIGLNVTYKSLEQNKYFRPLVANNRIILIEHEDNAKTVKAEVYLLTRIGIEVLKLASFRVNEDYFRSVAEDYVRKGFKVTIADWVQETADGGHFYNPEKVNIDQNA